MKKILSKIHEDGLIAISLLVGVLITGGLICCFLLLMPWEMISGLADCENRDGIPQKVCHPSGKSAFLHLFGVIGSVACGIIGGILLFGTLKHFKDE